MFTYGYVSTAGKRARAADRIAVLAVTPHPDAATYLVREVTESQLTAMFAAWRSDIDSVPFAHEPETETIVQMLLTVDEPGL